MATFYNQATLIYGTNTVNSNTTEAELLSGLELTKSAISGTYTANGSITYVISLTNSGGPVTDTLTLTDNLGAYTLETGTVAVPLNYVNGSIRYYLDGVLQPAPTVTAVGDLEISGIDLPAGSTATFIYEAAVNEFAPIAAGSQIINTVSTNGGIGVGVISASAAVEIREGAQLSIAKAVCPAVVSGNGPLTYTLIVQNLGNSPIVATDDVTVTDVFSPILSEISVTLDGAALAEGTGYTYDATTGEFATLPGTITVPAATYVQNPTTGAVTTVPGVTVLTVTGTV